MQEIEGAYSYGEIPSDNEFHVRAGFKCPYCGKRHIQLVTGKGTVADGVVLKVKCQRGFVKVVPYRQ
jgi:hypothetical protein